MNKLMLAGIAGCLGATLAAAPALAQSKSNRQEGRFVTEAIQGNFAEQQMGDLAQQKGQSQAVKDFGAELKKDHAAANDQLTPIAGQVGVQAPSEPSAKQKKDYDRLARTSGRAFDEAFVRHMVMDHKQDIAKYQKAASMTGSPVATYASQSLPVLQKHLATAESLAASGNRGAMGSGSSSDANMHNGMSGTGGNPSLGNGNSTGTGTGTGTGMGSGSSGGTMQPQR